MSRAHADMQRVFRQPAPANASYRRKTGTTGWTTSVTSKLTPALAGTGESAQAARLSSSTARNQGTTRFQLAKVWLTNSLGNFAVSRLSAGGHPRQGGRLDPVLNLLRNQTPNPPFPTLSRAACPMSTCSTESVVSQFRSRR